MNSRSKNIRTRTCVGAYAPATVANVTCGFDVLGFAIHEPGDHVVARLGEKKGVRITAITGDQGTLPLEASQNTAGVAVMSLLDSLNEPPGIELEVHKHMPLGSGLGSSAASAVAAVVAVNRLLHDVADSRTLLRCAAEGERIACGSAHLDNVAPSLLGGFTLVRNQELADVIPLKCPVPLVAAVLHPHIEVRTEDTRNLLRKQVALKKAVHQWANVGGLVAGILTGDYGLMARSMEDVILEPVRSLLIPGFTDIRTAALDSGVLGAGISGSGPSVFTLSSTRETAMKAGEAMQEVTDALGLASRVYISDINSAGAVVREDY